MNIGSIYKLISISVLCVLLTTTGACKLLGLDDENDSRTQAIIAALLLTQVTQGVQSGTVCTNSALSGSITSNTNGCGTLSGIVTVESGATLTINAGTTIQAAAGSALIIKPGGQLVAIGSAAAPIIFTSSKSSGSRAAGDWGGITLVGSSTNTNSSTQTIEASSSVSYGGSASNTTTDSSGTMQYVRIEFTGETINSVAQNCLSLYTVGSGTTIDHVQCHMSADDGFVWFGGTVNAKNLLATGTADIGFYMTEGYTGSLQYLINHQYAPGNGVTYSALPHGMDVYGTPTGAAPTGNASYTGPTVQNVSLHGAGQGTSYGIFARNGAVGTFITGTMYNFPTDNLRCNDNAGGGSNTNPTITYRGDNSQGSTSGGQCTNIAGTTANLTAQPYTSAGNVANNTAPNYTSTAGTSNCGTASSSSFLVADSTCGGMTSTSGNWADGWTFYQPN